MLRTMKLQPSSALIAACVLVLVACIASAAGAAFTNLWLVNTNCQPAGLPGYHTWRIYAHFNNPGDRLVSVFGSPSSPATITSTTGGFYQDPLGGNTAPDGDLFALFPTLQWDTFCTIGLARDDDGADQTLTTPSFPALPVSGHTNMAWYVPALISEQGAPDAGGFVLILQLTLPPGAFFGQCNVGLQYHRAGSTSMVTVNNVSPVLLPLTAGDINGDTQVNVNDLLLVITTWGQSGPGAADANDDQVVDVNDLLIVITHWGLGPGSC